MKTKFTRGPWSIHPRASTRIVNADDRTICATGVSVSNEYDMDPENVANAHLIAAAPDLYAALESAPDPSKFDDGDGGWMTTEFCFAYGGWWAARHKALAKARGETL